MEAKEEAAQSPPTAAAQSQLLMVVVRNESGETEVGWACAELEGRQTCSQDMSQLWVGQS